MTGPNNGQDYGQLGNQINSRPYIIGIAGASGSGKTSFAAHLYHRLLPEGVSLLSVDDYYMEDLSSVIVPAPNIHQADMPDAVELDLLTEHIESLISGHPVERPAYDFVSNSRMRKTIRVYPTQFLIVEGVYAFYHNNLTHYFDTKVFVKLPLTECLRRRLQRDSTQRGRSPEQVIKRFKESIIPTYNMYVLPFSKNADVVISGNADLDQSVTSAVIHIKATRPGLL